MTHDLDEGRQADAKRKLAAGAWHCRLAGAPLVPAIKAKAPLAFIRATMLRSAGLRPSRINRADNDNQGGDDHAA